ncbi:methyltransferase [candidate division CSSED10-310 bacterium]|uniref:Methyltransferase n=1 Tax=candidate division CSSED10-310 bacterium TaxID=2855610 RepID=A0ABV6YWA8_UNCC1
MNSLQEHKRTVDACHDPYRRLRNRVRWLIDLSRKKRLLKQLATSDFIEVCDIELMVLTGVFHPQIFITGIHFCRLLQQIFPRTKFTTVLDMGTGSGICALLAAQYVQTVDAIDINPVAVSCARANVRLNRLQNKVTVWEGHLFEPVADKLYDCICFNPPFYTGIPQSHPESALYGGQALETIRDFARKAPDHLVSPGTVFLLLSTDGQCEQIVNIMAEYGFQCSLVQQKELIIERLLLVQCRLSSHRS